MNPRLCRLLGVRGGGRGRRPVVPGAVIGECKSIIGGIAFFFFFPVGGLITAACHTWPIEHIDDR